MFDTTKIDLMDIIKKIDDAKLQLPDFQRDYVWGDDDVRSLIASIAKGFPIGALLTLETGGEVEFKPRVMSGVEKNGTYPEELLLDGQQRMTSLYQSLFVRNPVRTRTRRDTEIERFYYLDIKAALTTDADIEQAIVGVPADKIVRTNFGKDIILDLSSTELEFENHMFPLNQIFDCMNWLFGWDDYWKDSNTSVSALRNEFYHQIVEIIVHYEVPIIRLDKKNSREAICLVFEKVNVGGKKLDAFELVTAIYAAHNFDLREDWNGTVSKDKPGRKKRMIGTEHPRIVLKHIAATDFLQSCTILHTREERIAKIKSGARDKEVPKISCSRQSLLGLPLEAYQRFANTVEDGFVETAAYLNEMKIIDARDVPYPPQMVAIASVFAILGKTVKNIAAKEKLSRWFWSVTLGELYGSSTESRLARDVPELVDWISGIGLKPRTIDEAIFQQDRLRTLRSRNSAAYKAIHALLMKSGCRDFITGKSVELMTFFQDDIDIHHIFPKAWCKNNNIKQGKYNCIVNKTPLSKLSNITVGGIAPSAYLKKIEDNQGISATVLDDILRSHLIQPEHLRNDDFDSFFSARLISLSKLVSEAMCKHVVEDNIQNEPEREVVNDNEEFADSFTK